MSTATQFIIGSDVRCSDGPGGELKRVVVDPIARSITHLVVESHHRRGNGHLVPVDRVVSATPEVTLSCTITELHMMDDAEDLRFLPGGGGVWNYEPEQMLSWAYYPLSVELGMAGGSPMSGVRAGPHAVMTDRVPVGEVEVRRGDAVHATDGAIGHVQGLIIDPADHHVTHVLLDEGHLWGHKRVSIPIGSVSALGDVVRVSLTKSEVGELPDIALDGAGGAG